MARSHRKNSMNEHYVAGDIAVHRENGAEMLDLRQITVPPKPLVAILELLEHPATGNRVVVRISRDPVHLYPELSERNWAWTTEHDGDGGYRLTLTRRPATTPRP